MTIPRDTPQLTLGTLIDRLEQWTAERAEADPDDVERWGPWNVTVNVAIGVENLLARNHCGIGLGHEHSYRGYYQDLAFEPSGYTESRRLLLQCKRALGGTYIGYKGGEFTMTEHTYLWIASYGTCSDALMLTDVVRTEVQATHPDDRSTYQDVWFLAQHAPGHGYRLDLSEGTYKHDGLMP